MNELIPFYEPGDRITGHNANAGTIPGKRLVAIAANRQPGPELTTDGLGGNIVINFPTAGGRVFGVTSHDVPSGGKVTIVRGPGFVVPIKAAAALTAGAEVDTDAQGQVVAHAAGVAVGFVVDGCASGEDAQVALY